MTLFLSFSIFFDALTPAWAMQESLDREVSPPRRLLRTKEEKEDLTSISIHNSDNINQRQQDVMRLQASIQNIIEKTHKDPAFYNVAPRVIVLGPTGSGKTALINGLAGRPLHTIKRGRGFCIDTNTPLPNLHISHNSRVGTKLPASWHDKENNIVYWDCPGFGDPRGPEADTTNAFAIDQLFRSASKFVLVVPQSCLDDNRSTGFYNLLNEVTNLFINKDQLQSGLSLIITKKKEEFNPYEVLSELVEEERQEEECPLSGRILTSRALSVLEFLSMNTNRVSYLSCPQQEGEYQFNKQDILASIGAANFIDNPAHTLNINSETATLVEKFAQRLNEGVTHFIETEVVQEIKGFCEKQTHEYSGPVKRLRENLQVHEIRLEALKNTSQEDPLVFASGLETFSDISALRKLIEHIRFLKKINPGISYSTEKWSTALEKPIKQIQRFTSDPKKEFDNEVLNITGTLLGTTDVQEAMEEYEEPIRKVEAKSDYFLFIDKNIESPSTHLSFKAPVWRVIGTRVIDISGKPGESKGSDGGNGGNFEGYGDIFFGLENLTISLDGGKGANGKDGTDAKVCYVKNRMQDGENKALISREKYTNRSLKDFFMNWGVKFILTANHQFIETYETRGAFGTPGGNAGQGGVCKIFDGLREGSDVIKHFKGKSGTPGRRGKDGRTYRGVYFAEYAFPFFQGIREEDGEKSPVVKLASEVKTPVVLEGPLLGKLFYRKQ